MRSPLLISLCTGSHISAWEEDKAKTASLQYRCHGCMDGGKREEEETIWFSFGCGLSGVAFSLGTYTVFTRDKLCWKVTLHGFYFCLDKENVQFLLIPHNLTLLVSDTYTHTYVLSTSVCIYSHFLKKEDKLVEPLETNYCQLIRQTGGRVYTSWLPHLKCQQLWSEPEIGRVGSMR